MDCLAAYPVAAVSVGTFRPLLAIFETPWPDVGIPFYSAPVTAGAFFARAVDLVIAPAFTETGELRRITLRWFLLQIFSAPAPAYARFRENPS